MNETVVKANLRVLRMRRGWTQSEFGRRLTAAGLRGAAGGEMTQPMVSFLETGYTPITDDVIEAACAVFRIPPYMLEATSTSVTEVAEIADQLVSLSARLSAVSVSSPSELARR